RRSADASRTIATMPVREPSYMHSFALTPRYVVLLENPLVVNPLRLATSGKAFIHNYRWKPELGVRVHAFDRATGALHRTWVADPFFVFHTINAFEDGDDLVVDLCAHADARIIELLELDRLRAGTDHGSLAARPVRLTLPAGGGRAAMRELADVDLELPRINYRKRHGPPHPHPERAHTGGAERR